jgi:SH3 domain-containing YSC84-like protein 1
MNDDGMRNLLQDKFQIGGNASAAVGPLGRHASAGTDWKVGTQILTYSRAHGLFAGIDLDGSWVQRDKDATLAMYGTEHTTTQILTGEVPVPEEAHAFLAEVERAKSRDNRAGMD